MFGCGAFGGLESSPEEASPPKPSSPGALLARDPLGRLLEGLGRQLEEPTAALRAACPPDAVLVLAGDAFPVHRQILALHSPVLAALLAGPPDEAAAAELAEGEDRELAGLPAYRLAFPEHERPSPQLQERAAARFFYPRVGEFPSLTPASCAIFLHFCYTGQLPLGVDELPLGRLLALGALLRSPRFVAAVDADRQAALLAGGGERWSEGEEESAELAMKYRLPKTAAALIPWLLEREGEEESSEGSNVFREHDWEAPWDKLDATCQKLGFGLARAPPATRAKHGIHSARDMAAALEKALAEEGWDKGAEWLQAPPAPAPAAPAAEKGEGEGAAAGGSRAAGAAGRDPRLVEAEAGAPREAPAAGAAGGARADSVEPGGGGEGPAVMTAEALAATPYKELQRMAKEQGLKASGKADELAKRILEHQQGEKGEQADE